MRVLEHPASVNVVQRKVETEDTAVLEVDKEPGLVELERKRLLPGADFHPAVAGLLFEPHVVDEAPPAVLARIGRSLMTRAERNPASDAEPARRPVVRRAESNAPHAIAIEGDRYLCPVKAVVTLDCIAIPLNHVEAMSHLAVLVLNVRPRRAKSDVAHPAPRNQERWIPLRSDVS